MSSSTPRTLVLGIDPGFTGALAYYAPHSGTLYIHDMPVRDVGGKNHLDLALLSQILKTYEHQTLLSMIEEVGARPGQGVVSMFRFGYASGAVAGAVASHSIPIYFTKPQVWKMLMGLSRDKNLSRTKAMELFPKYKELFKRKKDDGRAEAALLAYFAADRFTKREGKLK